DGGLEGQWGPFQKKFYPIQAKRHVAVATADLKAPSIEGIWEVEDVKSAKGESTWRLIVHQTGPEASAAILRVDGDTGALTGSYQNGKFILSHFDGARPLLLTVTPQNDGTLTLESSGQRSA